MAVSTSTSENAANMRHRALYNQVAAGSQRKPIDSPAAPTAVKTIQARARRANARVCAINEDLCALQFRGYDKRTA